jgi:hypothetical protein
MQATQLWQICLATATPGRWLTVHDNVGFGIAPKRSPTEREEIVRHYVAMVGPTGFEAKARTWSRTSCSMVHAETGFDVAAVVPDIKAPLASPPQA